jgi:hypothetical protein
MPVGLTFTRIVTLVLAIVGLIGSPLAGYAIATELLQNGEKGVIGLLLGPVVYAVVAALIGWLSKALRRPWVWHVGIWLISAPSILVTIADLAGFNLLL